MKGNGGLKMVMNMPKIMRGFAALGNSSLHHPEVRRMMQEEKIDIVIVGFFMNNFLLGIADHFKCPSIVLSSQGPNTMISKRNKFKLELKLKEVFRHSGWEPGGRFWSVARFLQGQTTI